MATVVLENLTKRFGKTQAVNDVSLAVMPGEIFGLLGPNGAGKSTFLKAILGLIKVRPEMVIYDGRPVGGTPAWDMVAGGIAMVPEGRRLFAGMSVEDNMRVAIDRARVPAGGTALMQFGIL